jgi:hypothetical protein
MGYVPLNACFRLVAVIQYSLATGSIRPTPVIDHS